MARRIDLSKSGVIKAGFKRPHDVICHNGRYVVTDTDNNRIISVNESDSNFYNNIYRGKSSFHPYGIVAVSDTEDHFLITDIGGNNEFGCVYELKSGNLSRWADNFPSFGSPTGIAICDGEVYVADWTQGQIFVFNMSGAYQREIGGGGLNRPWFLAFNSEKSLYVADLERIRKYSTKGTIESAFTISTAGKTWHYRGIAIDCYDNIYITARSDNAFFTKETITVLNKNHMPLDNITGGWRTFDYLRGICIDHQRSKVVVVDGQWHELKVYNL